MIFWNFGVSTYFFCVSTKENLVENKNSKNCKKLLKAEVVKNVVQVPIKIKNSGKNMKKNFGILTEKFGDLTKNFLSWSYNFELEFMNVSDHWLCSAWTFSTVQRSWQFAWKFLSVLRPFLFEDCLKTVRNGHANFQKLPSRNTVTLWNE